MSSPEEHLISASVLAEKIKSSIRKCVGKANSEEKKPKTTTQNEKEGSK